MPDNLLSHSAKPASLDQTVAEVKYKIEKAGDKPHVSKAEQLSLLDEILQCDIGRFLIVNRGLDGFWTHYVCTYPNEGKITGKNLHGKPFNAMEKFLVETRPMAQATQERFQYFLKLAQKELKDSAKLAAVPCGVMGELLYLDFSAAINFQLFGIDLDPQALEHARSLAKRLNLESACKFIECDAWHLPFKNEFDVLTSSGLNVYVPEEERVVALYRSFKEALKPGGRLITSFLTIPPWVSEKESEWNLKEIDREAIRMQQIVYHDIIGFQGQYFYSSSKMKELIKSAGFAEIEIVSDSAFLFPTLIARRGN